MFPNLTVHENVGFGLDVRVPEPEERALVHRVIYERMAVIGCGLIGSSVIRAARAAGAVGTIATVAAAANRTPTAGPAPAG